MDLGETKRAFQTEHNAKIRVLNYDANLGQNKKSGGLCLYLNYKNMFHVLQPDAVLVPFCASFGDCESVGPSEDCAAAAAAAAISSVT